MSLHGQGFYAFGPFRLDAATRVLLRDGDMVALPPKAVDVLFVLVESAGRLVEKTELLAKAWPDTFVEDGNLSVNIFTLRKALNAGDDEGEYIRTVPRRGYTFVAEVTEEPATVRRGIAPSGELLATPAPLTAAPARTSHPWFLRASVGILLIVVVGLSSLSYVRTSRRGTVVVPGGANALAVLPFASPGSEPGDEHLGPGLASAIAGRLLFLQKVMVRPVSSTLKYGDAAQDPLEAGRALRVDTVLHGTLRKAGDAVQVDTTLVRVADGTQLWHWSTTTTTRELAQAQVTIADNVATVLEPSATAEERAAVTRAPGSSPDAYDSYLRARSAASQMTSRDVEQAINDFTRATDLSPDYADAFSSLAAYLTLPMNTASTAEKYARGETAARRALALNDTLAEPHTVLGRVAVVNGWDWPTAEREFRTAISRAPYDPEPHFWYSLLLSAKGRHDDALSEIQFALQADPTSPRSNLYYGMLLFMARRYDEAVAQLKKSPIEMGVHNLQVYLAMALAQAKKGRLDQALATLERASGRTPPPALWTAHRAYILAAASKRSDAEPLLAQLSDADPLRPNHTLIAATLACSGRMDEAIARLERAVEDRESRIIFMGVDPILDCARRDARFGALVTKIKLREGS
jgi:DNA-binding winged helix-turn-helix (wHTH) protein/tetratricopeptide (TPR) repeat protein/TolB-like protein